MGEVFGAQVMYDPSVPASSQPTFVLISAYASPRVGTGHLRRMMSLAAGFIAQGARLAFHTSQLGARILADSPLAGQLAALHVVSAASPAECSTAEESQVAVVDLIHHLPAIAPDLLILDNYIWDQPAESFLRAHCRFLAIYDDLATTNHTADLVINQNANATAARYAGRLSDDCKLICGADYALLATPFRISRAAGLPSPELRADREAVFISLGGGDPHNDLPKIVRLILENTTFSTSVATGSHIAGVQTLRALAARWPGRLDLCFDSQTVAEQMLAAGFAVAAGGTMTWERAVLGLPSLCLIIADNQLETSRWMQACDLHAVFDLRGDWDEADFVAKLRAYSADRARRIRHSRATAALIDGKGVATTVAAMLSALANKYDD